MLSPEFLNLRKVLISFIREENLKAMGGEIDETAPHGLNAYAIMPLPLCP